MTVVYRNENSYCGPISMLKHLAHGDLVLVFREALRREFASHCDPTTRTSLIRSNDGGRTWHSQVSPDPTGGNGTTINQFSDGTVMVSSFHWKFAPFSEKDTLKGMGGYLEHEPLQLACACEGVFTVSSQTDGYTWTAPQKIHPPGFKGWDSAGRVVELPDGSLLMPMNGEKPDDTHGRCWVMRSADRGMSWEFLGMVASDQGVRDFHELRILPLPSGRILAMMRTPDANFFQCHSDDGGKTWSALEETPIWCGGSSPGDLLLLRDRRVLCTYGHRRPPYGVRACLSEDEGRTWDITHEVVLRDDGLDRDMGYPSSEQLDDGTIITVYYWHEEDGIRYLAGSCWSAD